jgi:hypothetical protein
MRRFWLTKRTVTGVALVMVISLLLPVVETIPFRGQLLTRI